MGREERVVEAVLDWVGASPDRAPHLPALLAATQPACLAGPASLGRLLQHSLLQAAPAARQLLEQWQPYHALTRAEQLQYWQDRPRPSRWPRLLVCLSYAEKTLEYYDFLEER